MVYFFPVIPAVGGGDGDSSSLVYMLLYVNLFFNALPCILTALALWWTARWRRVRHPWLAMIPLADLWILGSLADRYCNRRQGRQTHMHRILPLLGTTALVCTLLAELLLNLPEWPGINPRMAMGLDIAAILPAIGAWGAFLVTRFVALCHLYEGFAPGNPGVYLALSIVFPPLIPLFIFKCYW